MHAVWVLIQLPTISAAYTLHKGRLQSSAASINYAQKTAYLRCTLANLVDPQRKAALNVELEWPNHAGRQLSSGAQIMGTTTDSRASPSVEQPSSQTQTQHQNIPSNLSEDHHSEHDQQLRQLGTQSACPAQPLGLQQPHDAICTSVAAPAAAAAIKQAPSSSQQLGATSMLDRVLQQQDFVQV